MSVARSKHREKVQARVDWLAKKLANWKPGTVRDENIRATMKEEKEALDWLLRREAQLQVMEDRQ